MPQSPPTATSPRAPPAALWPLPGTLVLGTLLAAGLGLRLWLAAGVGSREDGIYWPDEVFQSLEPAHRRVFGYGFIAWEFVKGARNWAFPGFIAAVMKLAVLLGMGTPARYLFAVRAVMCTVGVATGLGVFQLARRLAAPVPAALSAVALFLFSAPSIYFAHRALSETASALPLVFGFALALPRSATRRERLAGASLLALATLLRLQCGLFCVVLLGVLLVRRKARAAGEVAAVFLLGAFVFGLLDRLTWGQWFHSAVEYLTFNLVEGRASAWGTAAPGYYVRVLFQSMPLPTLLLAALIPFSWRRGTRGLGVAAAVFLTLHVATPHKELRFLLPAFPLLFALLALGMDRVSPRFVPRQALLAAVGVATLVSFARFRALTFGDLGQYEDSRPQSSAYDDFGSVNRLLLAANRAPDLCGLKVEVAHLAWTGGYTYLHRPVPFYGPGGPPRETRRFNYALTVPRAAGEGRTVAREGALLLVKLFDGACAPDPGFSSLLP